MTTTTNKRKTTNNKNNEDLTYRIKFSDPQREAAKQKTIQNQQTQQMKNLQKPTRTILIENLPDSHMDRYDFKSFFEVFGAVEQYSTFQSTVTLPHNDRIVTINCGAVRFESVEEAVAAVRALHGKFISGDSSIAGKNLGGKKGGSTEALIMSYVQGKQFPTGAPASSSKNVASQQQQQQKTAPSSSSNKKSKNEEQQQQQVNKQLSQQLVHMGFNKQQAEEALLAVSNSSVEDAVDYIESNFSTGRSASDSAQQEQQEDGGLTKEEKLQEKKRLKKERQRLQKLQQSPPQVESSNEKNEQEEKREEKTVLKEEKKNKTLTEPHQAQKEKSASSSDENSDDMKNKVIQLVEKMKFQVSNDDFVKFRKLSADFQRGLIHANEYYRVFYKMFANDEESIFFLLLETMPNRDLRKVESLIVARHTFHDQQQQVQADKTSSNDDQDKKKKKKKKKSSDQGSGATVTQNQAKTTGKSNVVVDKNNPFASLEDFDEDQAPSANKTAKKKSQKKKK